MTPPSDVGSQQQFNGSSRWVGLNTVLYLATGLNRSQTYQVELIQSDPRVLWVDLSKVIVFNALP